jgi:hypothetical protein
MLGLVPCLQIQNAGLLCLCVSVSVSVSVSARLRIFRGALAFSSPKVVPASQDPNIDLKVNIWILRGFAKTRAKHVFPYFLHMPDLLWGSQTFPAYC